MSETQITVLIVDDHEVVRQGVKTFLEMQPDFDVIGEADSGETAVKLAAEHAPDVVLLDLLMPGMDGVMATRQIKDVSPRSQIIILTSYHQDEHIFPAIQAGALSYLLKNVKPAVLAEAVRKAAVQEAMLDPNVAARIIRELHSPNRTNLNPYMELTERELEILQLVAKGLSNAEIAEKLFVTVKTVRSHMSNILSKLHLRDRTQAAVYAWREGIVRRQE
ncbi:MAG: response regulator transcription factor [Chloroflexota bacterium]